MADSVREREYTYTTYTPRDLKWTENFGDDVPYEVIGNVIYLMSASPRHEVMVMEIGRQLGNFLHGKPCRVFGSNLGYDWTARLIEAGFIGPEDKKQKILPDISVVCEERNFGEGDYTGIPSLIIEVLSPSTANRDFDIKKKIYEAVGVKEYWVIFDARTVHTYILENGLFTHRLHEAENGILRVPVVIFPPLEIEFDRSELDIT